MAELEWIFLQNAAVAAALLGDEAAQTLREKLLAETAMDGSLSQRLAQKAEQNDSAERLESESADFQIAQMLLKTSADETGGPTIFGQRAENGSTRMNAPAYADADANTDADGMRILEALAGTEEAARIFGGKTDSVQSLTQWPDVPTGAQLLLEELGQEGLWNGGMTLRAEQPVKVQESRSETLPQNARTEAELRRAGQSENFQLGDETISTGRQSASAGREWLNAGTENDNFAGWLGAGEARAAYAGGASKSSAGSASTSASLPGSRSEGSAGQSSMAEISRFFERDARRYGQ